LPGALGRSTLSRAKLDLVTIFRLVVDFGVVSVGEGCRFNWLLGRVLLEELCVDLVTADRLDLDTTIPLEIGFVV
jgi:hypothetical protein